MVGETPQQCNAQAGTWRSHDRGLPATRGKRLPLVAVRELQVWEVTPRVRNELMVVAEAMELLRVGELRVAGDLGKVLVEVRLVLYARTVLVARNARHELGVVLWVAGLLVGERVYLVTWTLMAGCEHGSGSSTRQEEIC